MSTDFSFIEYSYNPSITPTQQVYGGLSQLGCVHRSQHLLGTSGFWNQNRCIILLREVDTDIVPQVTGIGFIATEAVIEELDAVYEDEADVFVAVAPGGLRILLVPDHHARVTMDERYIILDRTRNYLGPLDSIVGVVLGVPSSSTLILMCNYLSRMGFKQFKQQGAFTTLVSNNRRFSMVLELGTENDQVKAVICDTPDVFDATAMFSLSHVKLRQFDSANHNDLNFGKLNASIVGYNLLAEGNMDSYSIENLAESISPGLDLIFRQRKQFLHISEHTLQTYYATSHS